MLRGRLFRRRAVCDLDKVITEAEDVDEDDDERLELDVHARAQREIACSTPAEIAPNRPPKTLELELEDEDEEEDMEDGDLGGPGVCGGCPR